MQSTFSLLTALKKDHPTITFLPGDTFQWTPGARTIYYSDPKDTASLLHETAHALLNHEDYAYDIDLLKMERAAWELVVTSLAKQYDVHIESQYIEETLDTYRDWLHSRSLCPDCEATGIQTASNLYLCLACHRAWRVNGAKSCALRRYKIK